MDVFDYMGFTNPDAVWDLCVKYNYDMSDLTKADAGNCARQLVKDNGDAAMAELLYYHPERDIILETFTARDPYYDRRTPRDRVNSMVQYMDADGSTTLGPSMTVGQTSGRASIINKTGVLLIVGALILAIGIGFVHTRK